MSIWSVFLILALVLNKPFFLKDFSIAMALNEGIFTVIMIIILACNWSKYSENLPTPPAVVPSRANFSRGIPENQDSEPVPYITGQANYGAYFNEDFSSSPNRPGSRAEDDLPGYPDSADNAPSAPPIFNLDRRDTVQQIDDMFDDVLRSGSEYDVYKNNVRNFEDDAPPPTYEQAKDLWYKTELVNHYTFCKRLKPTS